MAEQEESGPISVHEQSRSPGKAWKAIKQKRKYKEIEVQNPKEPKQEGFTRFVCVSDTHSRTDKMCELVPPGDVLLHAGDFTSHSKDEEFEKFNKWLGTLPHPHKLVIAGNHEIGLDPTMSSQLRGYRKLAGGKRNFDKKTFLSFLTNCTYLEDKAVDICGFKIYGSPWQPKYRSGAFNLNRGADLLKKWEKIPDNIDILVTHTPPVGYGDESGDTLSGHAGCVELLNTVQQRVKPKYHVFGHIHEGYGMYTDDVTTFINAAICTTRYKPVNQPIVFDLPTPSHRKS